MCSAEMPTLDQPAILGGQPVRPEGPPVWPGPNADVRDAVLRALRDGSWGQYLGPHTRKLERELCDYFGCEHVVLCSSGTAAVELALRGLRVEAGDEVILAAYDFAGNFHNVLVVGGHPVLVDVAASNWNLDPDRVMDAVRSATRALIVSHLHGGLVPMRQLVAQMGARGITVIEDACQMPGARIEGRAVGMWGDVGILSFGGSKLLSAGRGGALITDRPDVIQRVRLYTERGNSAYPLSELQAAVVLPQLQALDRQNRIRAENVRTLCRLLAEVPGIVPFQNDPGCQESEPGYYKLGLQYDTSAFEGLARDAFTRAVRAEGIALDPGFRALHQVHSRRRFRQVGKLAQATEADNRVVVLHHPVLLGAEQDIQQIRDAILKVQRHARAIQETVS